MAAAQGDSPATATVASAAGGNGRDLQQSLLAKLQAQRHAFQEGHGPDYRQRMNALDSLLRAVLARKEALAAALAEDFGGRADEETYLLDVFPLVEEIRHAQRHLKGWMQPARVPVSVLFFPGAARIVYQPLGVVGIIGPWNYQLLLSLAPLVSALAAGNHAMVKPSELAPRSAEVIRQLIADIFPAEYVTVVTGDEQVAAAFSALPFDHLLFTGSTRVGKLVMRAASEHLTPVTLELGGKSPTIVHWRYSLARAAGRLLAGKLFNAGQTCIAPDYLLLAEEQCAPFVKLAQRVVARLYPRLVDNPDYTRIINRRHYQRLMGLVEDARQKGAEVVTINPAAERCTEQNRVLPPTLVYRVSDDMAVMQEEIFGPILPIVPYRTLDDAIRYVNARPRPLALYYFDEDAERIEYVLTHTTTGGVTINDVMQHSAQPTLPFGGVGSSGMGHYHGIHGFETFSKKKAVFRQARYCLPPLFRPPYNPVLKYLIRSLIRA